MIKNSTHDWNSGGALRNLWKSPWTVWVGFRYLKSKKNSRFLSFITLLSIGGVAIGVTAMIVVLSVMDGFESELKKRMMATDLHILIQPTPETPTYEGGFVSSSSLNFSEIENAFPDLQKKVLHFWPVTSTEVILKAGKKVTGVVLKGVSDERIHQIQSQIVESKDSQGLRIDGEKDLLKGSSLPGVYMGQELAYEMGLIPGDEVTLVSPTETEGPLDSIPRLKRFMIEGIYSSGLPEQELHTVFTRERGVRSFLHKLDGVSQWEVVVKDFDEAPFIASKIRESAPTFKVQDWMQLNSHLFASLRLERASMFTILAFIVVVASFNIVTTLTLMVLEKKREISIIKAMGARDSQVAAIFLSEGILIGGSGILGGTLLGFLICVALRRYEFITLPDIYYDRNLPVTFDLRYYLLISVCAFAIVMVACVYPSKRAARLNPLDGIRFG